MPAEDMVDAALVGLDLGELVTIPGLHNGDEWTRFPGELPTLFTATSSFQFSTALNLDNGDFAPGSLLCQDRPDA
jgi:hypothetical protein